MVMRCRTRIAMSQQLRRTFQRMNLSRKLQVNWWIGAALAIPWSLFLLLHPYEVKGDVSSHWSYLSWCVSERMWAYCYEVLFWDVGTPCLFSWLGQYFIVLAWEKWRENQAQKPIPKH